ncbi:MAG: LysR family transcriptional regulator [Gammaproteobacteria bacterium]
MAFSLRQLRYFHAAAETGQISRAAVELNITQAAVTTGIRQLEESLGATLLVRSASGVTLTAAGERFLRHVRDILASIERAQQVVPDAEEAVGVVRVGVTYTIVGYFLAPLLGRFRRLYPGITLQLEEARRHEVEQIAAKGRCDFALVMTQGERAATNPRLKSRILYRSARRLWLPAGHPLLDAARVSFADVSREPYIALTVDDAWANALDYWKKLRQTPRVAFETASIEGLRTMVGMGLGVTILSDMLYRPWSIEGHRIETRDLDAPVPLLNVNMLVPVDRPLSTAARSLVSFLQRSNNLVYGG